MPKRKVTATVSGNTVILTGATALISDDIKELAKEYGLEYTWDGERKVWVVKGDRISEFIQQLQERASEKNIEFATTEGEVKEEAKAPLTELLKSVGFELNTVGVLSGFPFSGKTTFVVNLAEALLKQGIVSNSYVIFTEPNVLQGSETQLERARKILGDDKVLYYGGDDVFELERIVDEIIETTQNAFIAIDSVGELSLSMFHEMLKQYGASGGALTAAPRISPVVSSFANHIAKESAERKHTVVITTHLTQLPPPQQWFGLSVKPSFANRALHSVRFAWLIIVNPDGARSIQVAIHRQPQFIGRRVVLPPLSL
jgi:nucleoside-triphosphatase THEP1